MFPFIASSHTVDVVEKPQQAYEAAKQFGKFTKLLSGFNAAQLKITLPDFHNLTLRYQQFEMALETGNPERIVQSKDLIASIKLNKRIVDEYETCKEKFTVRVTHHDTKISNVLFDENDKGLWPLTLLPAAKTSVVRRAFFSIPIAGAVSWRCASSGLVPRLHSPSSTSSP